MLTRIFSYCRNWLVVCTKSFSIKAKFNLKKKVIYPPPYGLNFVYMYYLLYGCKLLFLLILFTGIIYDMIVEPPSVGQTVDEKGNARPVAFLAYR